MTKRDQILQLLEDGKSQHEVTKIVGCNSSYVTYCKDKKYLSKSYFNERNHQIKYTAVQYRGGCCQICQYDLCQSGLEFHHVDPMQKETSFASLCRGGRSFDTIRTELDKCLLVCCRCHREVHAAIHPQSMVEQLYKNSRPTKAFEESLKSMNRIISQPVLRVSDTNPDWRKRPRPELRKVVWPSKEELIELLKTKGTKEIGCSYGVADESVRRWCKIYGIGLMRTRRNWSR